MKLHKDKLKQQIAKIESDFEDKLKSLIDENSRLREQNDRLLSYGDNKDVAKQVSVLSLYFSAVSQEIVFFFMNNSF